jgi:hypothetical protein
MHTTMTMAGTSVSARAQQGSRKQTREGLKSAAKIPKNRPLLCVVGKYEVTAKEGKTKCTVSFNSKMNYVT